MKKLFAVAILLAASLSYAQSGGGHGSGTTPTSPCGDASHALGWTGSAFNCQAVSGSAAAGGSNTQLQYNNATALGGITGYTTNGTTTITGGASSILDISAGPVTTGLKIPTAAGAAPLVDGQSAFNSTTHTPVWGFNGASTITIPLTKACTASQWVNNYAQATGVLTCAQPAFSDISGTLSLTSSVFSNQGTATQVLHGNGAGVLSFGSVVNGDIAAGTIDVTAKITGVVPLANGGTNTNATLTGLVRGGTSYTAAELSGDATTSGTNAVTVVRINGNTVPSGAAAHQALIATGANAFSLKTINDCTGGASALSFAQTGDAFGCVTNVPSGAVGNTQVVFGTGTNSISSSANFVYSASSGITMLQGANAADMLFAKRFTDTTPTGNFFHFQNNGATLDLFKVDVAGGVTATSITTTNQAGNAGMLSLVQGNLATAVANAVNFTAPTSVSQYTETLPGAVGAGFWNQTAGGVISFGALSGDVTSSALVTTVAKVNGVTFGANPSNDTVPVISAANTATYTAVPNCGDASHGLNYNTTTHAFGCQAITGSAAAGGSNTQVQFNSSNALAGSANLTWVSPVLTIGASGVTGQLSIAGSTSGNTTLQAAATASGALTLPAATGTLTWTVASGTSALGTGAISSGTCATVVTTSATGTATTDTIQGSFNADPTGVTGYAPTSNGMLTIIGYPTTNNVNWKVCNNTTASITPGAITLNWRVVR